ncbi:MAG: hypothetical protein ACTSXO_08085 [Candidatus Heimdallarchaeota archaeon]
MAHRPSHVLTSSKIVIAVRVTIIVSWRTLEEKRRFNAEPIKTPKTLPTAIMTHNHKANCP